MIDFAAVNHSACAHPDNLWQGLTMTEHRPEVVRIGVGLAQVIAVTRDRIQYMNEQGNTSIIDLQECVMNWIAYSADTNVSNEIRRWNATCVGRRGALDNPPWVDFMNQRRTRFEFDSYEAIYAHMLGPLLSVGWRTFDMN